MPELAFGLHSWPGCPAQAVATAVLRAAESATGGGGVGAVRVTAMSPYAACVRVEVGRNVAGAVARAVECKLEHLRDPALRRKAL